MKDGGGVVVELEMQLTSFPRREPDAVRNWQSKLTDLLFPIFGSVFVSRFEGNYFFTNDRSIQAESVQLIGRDVCTC